MNDKIDKIIELKKMLDEKVITQEEFEVMKQELLENKKTEITPNSSNEKINKIIHYLKYWRKGLLASGIVFIITFVLKVFTNGFLWDFGTITLWMTIILFVVSMISGWYIMHKDKQKWPTWYTIIVGIIIAVVIANVISYCIEIAEEKRLQAVKQQIETELSNNSYSSDIDFNNPSSIKNGETIVKKYAKDLNCYIRNMNVQYLSTDNNGRYAFKGTVAISFSSNSSYSQMETWYVVLTIENNKYTYTGAYGYEAAKLASGWNTTKNNDNLNYTDNSNYEEVSKYLPVKDGITITIISKPKPNTYRGFWNICSYYGEVLEYNWDDNNIALINLRVEKSMLEEICKELEKTGQIEQIIK